MALAGIKVVEFGGLAPGPYAGLILSDFGASVIRIDKPSSHSTDVLCRGKRSLAINPKIQSGREALKKIIRDADVVIDPFRPGVMEKLGLGPDVFLGEKGENKKLIFARMVGFPRRGAYKDMAGHDINYLALSGVLAMLPGEGKPTFPLNLLGDFAGGGLMCALGILLALIERSKSGKGQVVEADMVSGARYTAAFPLIHTLLPSSPLWSQGRGNNILDGGSPFYDVYTCSDGQWMSVGCLEPQFVRAFLSTFLSALPKEFVDAEEWRGWKPNWEMMGDRDEWPTLKKWIGKAFMTRERDYWAEVFHGTDSCVAPVLSPDEARSAIPTDAPWPPAHPDLGRGSTPKGGPDPELLNPGDHTAEILKEFGINETEQRWLALDGALGEEAKAKAKIGQSKL